MNAATLPVTGMADAITDTATTLKLGCDAADYTGFTPGRIAIVQRGVCAFVDKGHLAQAAGASAIVVVNRDDTDPGALPTFLGASPSFFTIPMIGTDKTAKAALIGADGHTITLAAGGIIANPTYKNTADFSSGGPRDGDSFLKPDVTAPGVSISSAFVGSGTDAQTLSGTSMAAPNTTGVAALVVQAHPTWSPTRIKALIMNTASASPSLIVGYDPRLNGSGVVQPRRAVDSVGIATTGWGEASLSYGYDPRVSDLTDTRTITITNTSRKAITYRLSSSFVGDDLGAAVLFSHRTLRVPDHSSRTVRVTIRLSKADMANLPGADALPTEAVLVAEGAVTATPTTGGKGRYPLRVPFLVVPRSLSSVSASAAGHFTVDAGTGSGTVKLHNSGLHSGNADVYAWGQVDPKDGLRETDIRAVGAQSLAGAFGGLPDDDRLIGFAVNTYGRWTDAANNEVDVLVDTNRAGTPDFVVIAADSGLVLTGSVNGQVLGIVVDLSTGGLVDLWTVSAPTNGSTMVIYAAASDFGVTAASGPFDYAVDTFSLEGFGDDATSGFAGFDPFQPAVSQGDFIGLDHGDHATLPVTVDLAHFGAAPALGWMIVTMDDANGGRQADLVSLADVGSKIHVHGHH
jgi:minor extracellular serine protease Vpr